MDPSFDSKTAQNIADQSFEADSMDRAKETVAAADNAETQRQASRDAASKAYNDNVNAIGNAYASDLQNIDQEAAERLRKNAEELARTRSQWLAAIDEAAKPGDKGPQRKPPKLPDLAESATAASGGSTMGTFGSSALSQLGAGGVAQRIAIATEQTAKNTRKIADQDTSLEFE